MVQSADHITGATGLTPTVTLLKNGSSSFASPVGTVTEIGAGWYALSASAVDANTLGPLLLHAEAASADPRDDTFQVVNYNPNSVQPYSPPSIATFGTVSANDLIKRALRLIGVLAAGESLPAADAQDALTSLNDYVDYLSTQGLTALTTTREVFDLVASQAEYSIGVGEAWDALRPSWQDIENTTLLLNAFSPAVEIALPLYTEQAWQALPIKDLESTLPTGITYEPTQPNGTFTLYPVPTDDTNQVVVYRKSMLAAFATLSTQYSLAPGYRNALIYNLAVNLADEYGRVVPPQVMKLAGDYLSAVKALNYKQVDLGLDPAFTVNSRGTYNIYSDT